VTNTTIPTITVPPETEPQVQAQTTRPQVQTTYPATVEAPTTQPYTYDTTEPYSYDTSPYG
jgi:hypothetical protein